MDWKQLIASLVEHLAWPIAVIIMFFFVRDRVAHLIDKLGKLKYKDLELDFSKIKHHSPSVEPSEKAGDDKVVPIKDSESELVLEAFEEQIFEAVETAPIVSILLAWSYVETSLSSAISRLDLAGGSPSASPLHNIQILDRAGKISPLQLELLNELRSLRNKLAHGVSVGFNISSEQAIDYAGTAIELAKFIDGLDRKGKIFMIPRGEWVSTPQGFSPVKDKSASLWQYSYTELSGIDGITAGVGSWTAAQDAAPVYYGIDIELQQKGGSMVIAELLIDLKYVSDVSLFSTAKDIVSFNKESRIVTFDLGNSVFEYRFF